MSVKSWPNLNAIVDDLLGTQYEGQSCWQLFYTLYERGFGLDLAHDPTLLNTHFQQVWFQGDPRSPLSLVQPWDCLVFSAKGFVSDHCGVVVDEMFFVDTHERQGVRRRRLRDWEPKLLQIARLRELL